MTQTLFDMLWAAHRVCDAGDGADLIAIDRTMLHERTGGVALKALESAGRKVKDPARVFAIMDHIVSFRPGRGRDESRSPGGEVFVTETRDMAQRSGIHLIDTDDARQGIVHVVAPELGLALPGVSIVCPDSHTCTLGALGALAWGIGSSEAEHAMATGTLRVTKPRQMRVTVRGDWRSDITAKDLALHLIATHGAAGGQRMAIEFDGPAIRALDIDGRLTLCNMAVEFAAFTALIAPDEKTLAYVEGRPFAPSGVDGLAARQGWTALRTDPDAGFDAEIAIDLADVRAMATWGKSPEEANAVSDAAEVRLGGAFIGSCTNGRLSDLRAAAAILKGKRVAPNLRAVCVPGSQAVKRAAEAEGLDAIFKAAGFEWGEPGCAMCFYAGGETFAPGTHVISSTNRNFEGRQGPGVHTHLASPATVAASAIAGRIVAAPVVQTPAMEPAK